MAVKVYERILQLFEAEGIKTLFGIPDPNFVHMFVAAEKRGWTVVTPHHELAVGFMAEGYARMTGRPAVCNRDAGPGHRQRGRRDDVRQGREHPGDLHRWSTRRITEQRVRRGRIQFIKQAALFRKLGEVQREHRIRGADR